MLLAQLIPIVLALNGAASGVAQTGVFALELTESVVEEIPGLEGALYLLAIYGVGKDVARRLNAPSEEEETEQATADAHLPWI